MLSALVVGSGISGLSAAIFLAREGCEVQLWEEKKQNGGMLAPVFFQDVLCDRGSHRVHPESHPLLRELTASEQWLERSRQGILVFGGRQIPYPPTPSGFLRGLGLKSSLSMAWGFAVRPNRLSSFRSWEDDRTSVLHKDVGFEEFVIRRVGHSAYQQFYRPYVEKVWGLDPSEISRTVAKQRISTSSPLTTFRRAFNRKREVDRTFLYPQRGLGVLIESLRDQAVELGVSVQSEKRFEPLKHSSDFDVVLYSGHLNDLVPNLGLKHRGLYILHLAFPKGVVGNNDTWYVPESKYWFGRVSQPSYFSPSLEAADSDVLCVEIPEGRWGTGHSFLDHIKEVVEQLYDAKVISRREQPLSQKQTWLPKVYPLYHRNWLAKWRQAMDKVAQLERIFPIGRQGLFLHCNMDHCVHIAWEAVQQVVNNKDAGAWLKRCPKFLDLRVRD